MTQASRTKDQVIVKVTAEDEERRRYRWQCRLSLQQNVMPLKRMWAEAHGVEEEAVLFLDEAGCLVDLEKTPPQLGWKDTVELSSVPASDEWAEGGTAAKRRPKRAKVEKAPEQTQLAEKTQGNGAKMDLDAKPLADLGGSLPGDDEPVEFQAENPKRSGTTAYERYEKYKSAKTIAAAIEKGAARGDIINDFKKGFIRPL